jgi:class 3 adenylate cyclase
MRRGILKHSSAKRSNAADPVSPAASGAASSPEARRPPKRVGFHLAGFLDAGGTNMNSSHDDDSSSVLVDVLRHNEHQTHDSPPDLTMNLPLPTDPSGADSTDVATACLQKATQALNRNYDTSPWTMCFVDHELERDYVRFIVSSQGFFAGKLYSVLAGIIALSLLFPYLGFHLTREKFEQASVIALMTGVSIGWLCFGLLFTQVTLLAKEVIFFIAVATHWPAFASATIIAKEDGAYRYAYTTLCFMFCCFLAQPRFVGMFFFLTVTPIATMFTATFSKADYWDKHSRFEMLYWVMPLFPLFMLRIFERRSREAFVECGRAQAAIELLTNRVNITKKLVAHCFPVSASRRFVASKGFESHTTYPGAALVTCLASGFTEWAATVSVEQVVSRVSQTIRVFERLAWRYGVERINIDGDTFFGAVFTSSPAPSRLDSTLISDASPTATRDVLPRPDVSIELPLLPAPRVPPEAQSPGSLEMSEFISSTSPANLAAALPKFNPFGDRRVAEGAAEARVPVGARFTHHHHPTGSLDHTATTTDTTRSGAASGHGLEADPTCPGRCHRVLRFATAVRHHKDVMPMRIGVHVGTVIGGFVGIQPPKFDLFGPAVRRVRMLKRKGQLRRLHASDDIIRVASSLGHPSDDFTVSEFDGQIFSSWRPASRRSPRTCSAALAALVGTDDAAYGQPQGQRSPRPVASPRGAYAAGGSPRSAFAGRGSPRVLEPLAASPSPHAMKSPASDFSPAVSSFGLTATSNDERLQAYREVEAAAIVMCAYLMQYRDSQYRKASRSFAAREMLLRRTVQDAVQHQLQTSQGDLSMSRASGVDRAIAQFTGSIMMAAAGLDATSPPGASAADELDGSISYRQATSTASTIPLRSLPRTSPRVRPVAMMRLKISAAPIHKPSESPCSPTLAQRNPPPHRPCAPSRNRHRLVALRSRWRPATEVAALPRLPQANRAAWIKSPPTSARRRVGPASDCSPPSTRRLGASRCSGRVCGSALHGWRRATFATASAARSAAACTSSSR